MTHPNPAQQAYVPPPPPHQRSGAELRAAADLPPEAEALLAPDMPSREFALALAGAGRVTDAIAIVAHAMPRREAVWWAWACARRVLAEPIAPPVRAALDATERWIAQPTDAHRRATMQAAEAATFETPAGAAGLAAFFSGGSIAPAGLPDAHPTEFITARAVTASLLIAGVSGDDPTQAPARHAAFLQQGLDVMARLNLWPAA